MVLEVGETLWEMNRFSEGALGSIYHRAVRLRRCVRRNYDWSAAGIL